MNNEIEPRKIRISIGSAAVLDLAHIKTEVYPTTCYVMTYTQHNCKGNCLFCPQSNFTNEKEAKKLSRIQWPPYEFSTFIERLKANQENNNENTTHGIKFGRICFQVINYEGFYNDLVHMIEDIRKSKINIPISLASPPISRTQVLKLKKLGVERICFALDLCSEKLFEKIKGSKVGPAYSWKNHLKSLDEAVDIFGRGYVTTHFIVGLGENQKELLTFMRDCLERGIFPGIFLFSPVKGTPMGDRPRPPIKPFRYIQIARYLLLKNTKNYERFIFDNHNSLKKITQLSEEELTNIIKKQIAFKTAGCPDCNRPYYTSSPSEEQDGFPRDITRQEMIKIKSNLEDLIDK